MVFLSARSLVLLLKLPKFLAFLSNWGKFWCFQLLSFWLESLKEHSKSAWLCQWCHPFVKCSLCENMICSRFSDSILVQFEESKVQALSRQRTIITWLYGNVSLIFFWRWRQAGVGRSLWELHHLRAHKFHCLGFCCCAAGESNCMCKSLNSFIAHL